MMNREIQFRGQDIDTGEWVYGYFFVDSIASNILVGNIPYKVNFDTVGQFTNQHDKLNTKIFEDDILKMWIDDSVEPDGGVWCYMFVKETIEKGFVLWAKNMTIEDAAPLYQMLQEDDMEVVGNIHDNPELIKL